jgi:glyoxylase-like metal-dependent hydrolase (beta-lactamase superfamily II)
MAEAYPINTRIKPEATGFFDRRPAPSSYVVKDPQSNACAVIDSVTDIDYAAGRISYESADKIVDFIRRNDLKVERLIETHDCPSPIPSFSEVLSNILGPRAGIPSHG